MKKFLFLFLLVLPFCSFAPAHKFYVSVTEMEFRPEKQSLQIISRIFIDDFENMLKKNYNKELVLNTSEEPAETNEYIADYLTQNLKLNINGKPVKYKYLGKEYNEDMVLLYIEVVDLPKFEKINISNSLLFDLFEDQKNIVHVEVKDETKSLLLTRREREGTLNF